MISQEEIKRINVLARKQKAEGLTPTEKEEQAVLRRKYINAIKSSLKYSLDSIEIVDEDQTHNGQFKSHRKH